MKQVLLISLLLTVAWACSGPTCPGGCCPEEGYVCCNDGMYCAAALEKCPDTKNVLINSVSHLIDFENTNLMFIFHQASKIAKLETKAKLIMDSRCSGPTCPGGCCPEEGYVCCNDGMYCASTTEKCPETKSLISRILPRFSPRMIDQDCPGVWCPSGCCSKPGYVCCVNQQWCAPTENECPSP